jgi:hypothetical protein
MKMEEYAEHLIRVIRYETKRGQYETARTLAEELAGVLTGIATEQQKKHNSRVAV